MLTKAKSAWKVLWKSTTLWDNKNCNLKRSLNGNLHRWTMVPPQNVSYELLNKNISVRCGIAMEFPSSPKQYRPVSSALGCPPELDAKTLLQKTLHALFAECKEIKLESTWKFLLWWLAFRVLEVLYGLPEDKRHKQSYPAMDPACYSAILPGMMYPLVQKLSDFIRIITIFLTGFGAQSSGRNSLMVLQTWPRLRRFQVLLGVHYCWFSEQACCQNTF